MPSDEKHNRIGIIICCLLVLPLIHFGVDYALIILFAAAYMFATRYLSPDLDINSKPYQRWGALRVLWYPYMKVFKHRKSSHNLLIGPIITILYLSMIVIPAVYMLMYMWIPIAEWSIEYVRHLQPTKANGTLVLVVVAGIVSSIWTHISADAVFKGERQ